MNPKKYLCILLCVLVLASGVTVSAQNEWTEVYEGILDFAAAGDVQGWIDGELSEEPAGNAAWFVLGLGQWPGAEYDFSAYAAALEEHVTSEEETRATSRQKFALAFLASGHHSDFLASTAMDSLGEQGIMSWTMGLPLLRAGYAGQYSESEAVATILERQLPDGGWAVAGTVSDVDVTAMAIQTLAPYYESDTAVATAVDAALALLSERQLPDGDFKTNGVANPESGVQVLIALCALGRDPFAEPGFEKNGNSIWDGILKYRLPDGSFAHLEDMVYNTLATAQVFYGCAALERWATGAGSLYDFAAPQYSAAEALKAHSSLGWQVWAAIGIGAAALLLCLSFLLRKKKNWKNYVFVLLAAALLVYGVFSLDVQKTDDYYSAAGKSGDVSTTLTIRCDTVAGEAEHIPANGVILAETTVMVADDATAFDQLVLAVREHKLHMDKEEGAMGSVYVKGLANLYEFDYGDLSGWVFFVNGKSAEVGCGEYRLKAGDRVEWLYTTELGLDLERGNVMKETA
ncbi:MAG: DUF4430 domain-containing protein [Oscillospiraceae bacterium]|nr:DUF4430 domain-containing protein [Oscillospiraceae bacterium]